MINVFCGKIYFNSPQSRNIWAHFVSISYHVGSVATKHAADFATDLAKRRRRGAIPQEIPPPGSAFFFRHRRTRHDCRIERQESEIVAKGSKKVIVRKVYVRWSLPAPKKSKVKVDLAKGPGPNYSLRFFRLIFLYVFLRFYTFLRIFNVFLRFTQRNHKTIKCLKNT